MATVPPVGTAIAAGERIASLRRGLRTQHARAPVTGTIAALHPSGIVVLATADGSVAIRARHGGTVTCYDEHGIVVESAARCIPHAFGTNRAIGATRLVVLEPLLLGPLLTRAPLPPLPPDSALVVAHIADSKALAHTRQSGGALLIIGSLTEAVAWELSAHAAHDAGASATVTALVLAGLGDADIGVRAAAPLRARHGATVLVDDETHTLILVEDSCTPPAAQVPAEDEPGIVFRAPAEWGALGTQIGPIREHALETGFRVLAAGTTSVQRGTAITPIQNFGKLV
jgi:hypothetical protein